MHKLVKFFFSVFAFLFLSFGLYAQDTLDFEGFKTPKFAYKQNIVKFSPVPFLVGQIPLCGEIRITYERMIVHNQSLSIGISYNYPNLFLFVLPTTVNTNHSTISHYSFRGGRLTLSYRYYPLKRQAPKGFFAGPYLSYNFVKIKERSGGNGSYDILNFANISAVCGYQVKMGAHMFFEFLGGVGYRKNFWLTYDAQTGQQSTSDFSLLKQPIPVLHNIKFDLQINFGYGF